MMRANPKHSRQAASPSSRTGSGKGEATQEARSKPPLDSANDHFQYFQSTLARLQSEAQQRLQAAGFKCSEDLQKVQNDAFKPAREAYLRYLTSYHEFQADAQETTAASVCRAQFEYEEAHQNSVMKAQKICEERHRAYVEETRVIQAEVSAAWRSAFVEFVRAIKATIMDIDAATVEAWTLGSIGQSMLSAATSAQSAETGPTAR
jgi:tryptophan 2,3-dioxygenase